MKVGKISQFVQIQSKPMKRTTSKPFHYSQSKSYNVVVTQEHLFPLHGDCGLLVDDTATCPGGGGPQI